MEPTRDQITDWISDILRRTGETPSALARRAGLATTTLTRFLNDPGAPMLTLRSIAKIAHVSDTPPIGTPAVPARARIGGFGEQEAEKYEFSESGTPLDKAVRALIGGRSAADPWVLKTRALEMLGYRPGDICIVDLNAKAASGNPVCAQSYNWEHGRAETVFRVYEPPYLVAMTADPSLAELIRKPLLVDNDRVIIKGVVTDSLRVRRG